MKKRFARCLCVVGIAILSTTVGCEPANEATVSGQVTIDGEALTHGTVAFLAGSKNTAPAATGAIQSDGTFRVQIGQSGKLVTGEYVVTVTASSPSIPNPDGGPPTPGELITPVQYSSIVISGLRYNIRAGENLIDIALVSDSPESVAKVALECESEEDAGPEEEPVDEASAEEEPAAESVEKPTATSTEEAEVEEVTAE